MGRLHYLLAAASIASLAAASEAQAAAAPAVSDVEQVVVTGSHIVGLAQDAALPVDVINTADLRLKGSPSPVELMKSLPYITGGVLGDNSFTASSSRTSGSANVNLRGLSGVGTSGFERTLVLFNGERIANYNTTGMQTTDINTLPIFAVGRIETLKNGGSTAYGSDAIAGVVNFVTSKTLNGLDVGGDYQRIRGSDGNWNAHVNWGKVFDRGNFLLSAGYNHTSTLSSLDRSWANQPILTNPQSYLASANPGVYNIATSTGGAGPNRSFVDPGCSALGGVQSPVAGPSGAPICYTSKIPFQNIIDKSNRYQLYAELNLNLTDNLRFHLEGWHSRTEIPELAVYSTSGQANAFPTLADIGGAGVGKLPGNASIAGQAAAFYIPASNPGLRDFLGKYSAAQLGLTDAQYAFAAANGVNSGANWQIFGLGGQPAFPGNRATARILYRSERVSGGFDGVLLGDINWTTRFTFGQFTATTGFPDQWVQRTQLALRGLGGPGCTGATPGANGCVYFNPFSTAYASNPALGLTNPGFINNANVNSAALAQWMTDADENEGRTRVFTGEGGLTGKLGIELPGGKIGWAAGVQYRWNQFRNHPLKAANANLYPCTDEGVPASVCAPNLPGPLAFFGVNVPITVSSKTLAEYIEFNLPITDRLQLQIAGRHEDTQGVVTNDPKVSARWQVIKGLAFRASREETFKAPTPVQRDTSTPTNNSTALGQTRIPLITSGNANLKPETATSYDFGIIVNTGGLVATADFWSYRIRDQITPENAGSFAATMFPTALGNNGHCGEAAYAVLQSKFGFNGACGLTNVSQIRATFINGAEITTKGLDFDITYRHALGSGLLTLATNATRVLKFSQADQYLAGTPILVLATYNQAGKYNVGVVANGRPVPKWRDESYVNFAQGPHNFRWTTHYSAGYVDNRFGIGGAVDPGVSLAGFPAGTIVTTGQKVKAAVVHDVGYSYFTKTNWQFQVVATNVFDKDPPFARTDMSYSQETGSPLGRVFRFQVNKLF